jgi:hypothetical protein
MGTTTSQVSTANYDGDGYVRVTWTNAEKSSSPPFHSWGVWRRIYDEAQVNYGPWELLFDTGVNQANYEYRDFTPPSNRLVQYVVRQRTGTTTLTWDSFSPARTVTPPGTNYWLIHPTNAAKHLLLAHVTSDDFNFEREEEFLKLIGRGRKLDKGTNYGVTGTLNLDFRSRLDLLLLLNLWRDGAPLLLRNPFGDIWQVSIGEPGIGRTAGVGTQEFTEVSVPYREVA